MVNEWLLLRSCWYLDSVCHDFNQPGRGEDDEGWQVGLLLLELIALTVAALLHQTEIRLVFRYNGLQCLSQGCWKSGLQLQSLV